ncbi:MAG: hypothetical protein P8J87_03400 [Verrucomicrobiales bacterium]|nr:hypothetical protein [Verrucomicrobiales bacterium]
MEACCRQGEVGEAGPWDGVVGRGAGGSGGELMDGGEGIAVVEVADGFQEVSGVGGKREVSLPAGG